jgi:hypothetical protein
MKKRAIFGLPFNWIFALLVGAAVLFLAIYGVVKILDIGDPVKNTQTAAALVALFDPLETGLAEQISGGIYLNKEARLFFSCEHLENRPFGKQIIRYTEKRFGKFGKKSTPVPVTDKYVFAENIVEGKTLYVFSRPFFMPFKVGDMIIISSEEYCLYEAPNEFKKSFEGTELNNVKLITDLDNCTGSVVCFDLNNPKCDISVEGDCTDRKCESSYDYGSVVKDGKEMHYIGNLVYGAIFSDPETYECNVLRLMNRFDMLGELYLDKVNITEMKGCSSNTKVKLRVMMNSADDVRSSEDLISFGLYEKSKEVDLVNKAAKPVCRLFREE